MPLTTTSVVVEGTIDREAPSISESIERAGALVSAGVDVLVLDSSHAHSRGVLEALAALRERFPEVIQGQEGAPTVLFFTGCGINYMYPESGAALIKALPGVPGEEILWRFHFMLGAMSYAISGTDALHVVAEDALDDTDAVGQYLAEFRVDD